MSLPLPFDTKKQSGAVATEVMGDDSGMEAAASDILQAIEAKDTKALAAALKAAFELADSQPHEEGPHE